MKSSDSVLAEPSSNVAISAAKPHHPEPFGNTSGILTNTQRKRVFVNPVIGDRAILIKCGEETGGEYTLFQIEVAAGGGNSLHIHKTYSETFKVLEGELSVQTGKNHLVLYKGDSVTVPLNESHCFNNQSGESTKFSVEFRPAQPGFEKAIAIAYGLAVDGLVNKKSIPKKLSHLAILAALSGTVPAGPERFFLPVFHWIARRLHKTEQELINKYC